MNGGVANRIFLCKCRLSHAVCAILTQIYNLFCCQCRHKMPFASTFSQSPFTSGINRIVFECSKGQVIRIAARWIIALMKHIQSFRNWTITLFKHKSMCLLPFVVDCDTSISFRRFASLPNPTVTQTSNLHLAPKPFQNVDWIGAFFPIRFSCDATTFVNCHIICTVPIF